ncbi:MAG TPA: tetratricopeptide repeat protein [Candidatus Acidoferrum sp.]|nr:tetratricopeptide repeat protein [Candidatus Acidoferrum sp.]
MKLGAQANVTDELESLCSSGRYEQAITLGESILELERSAPGQGEVLIFLATANLQLGRIDRGEQLVAEAGAQLATAPDPGTLVECMALEASIAQMRQQANAIQLAQDALSSCRKLDPIPNRLEVQILNTLAAANLAAGIWEQAVGFYEEAIERAGPLFDMRRRAKLMGDVAIAYRELGRLDRSILFATRSVEILETLRDLVALARSENNLGLTFMAVGDLDGARTHLERSLELCHATNLEIGRSHVLLSLCELNAMEKKYTQARDFAQQALDYSERLQEPSSVAQAHLWLARVATSLGEPAIADCEFERAIDQLARTGEEEELLRSHALYSETLERRGEWRRAYEHLKAALAYATSNRLELAENGPPKW